MNVTRLVIGVGALGLLAWSCGSKHAATPDCDEECRPKAKAAYAPTAMEVPTLDDFVRAAEKRVGADNYPRELKRVERELTELEPDGPITGRH